MQYYSGFACEFCHPRLTESVDIEDGVVKRVRHHWNNFALKIDIIKQQLDFIEFYFEFVNMFKNNEKR